MDQISVDQAFGVAAGHYRAGRLLEAEGLYARILSVMPDQPDVLQMLAIVCHQLGRGSAGIELLRRAIDVKPGNAEFHSNLGVMLAGHGELQQAAVEAQKAIELRPDFADAHNNLGNVLKSLGRPDEALAAYRQAVASRADYAEGRNNLGVTLQERGELEEAIAELRRAIDIRPDYPEAHNNLANALQELGRLDEAIEIYRRALAIRPNYADAHRNLGTALRGKNQLVEAMTEFRTALDLQPQYAEALWSIAFLMLLQGDFVNGWRTFEARQKLGRRPLHWNLTDSVWNGEPLDGKSILLHGEQGLGDTIQFLRYIPMVKSRGGRIVLVCQSQLKRLLTGQLGIDHISSEGQGVRPCYTRCSLMSLPRVFGTSVETIPANVPYVFADPTLIQGWRTRLAQEPGRFNVGLVWSGNRRHLNDRNRSLPPSAFAALARIPNVRLFSLQKGPPAAEAKTAAFDIVDWTDDLRDLADTAALTANLDLVISVDTSVAHLAGAMAKRVWTLIPFAPDWRWMLNRSDSPWYPTMRLFRQPALGDWDTPLKQISQELSALAAG